MSGLKISELTASGLLDTLDVLPVTDVSATTTKKTTFLNLLNSFYSTGSWTPAITFATPGNLSVAYTSRIGTYTKIYNQVRVTWFILTSSFTHTTASGNFQIAGLPFTCSASGHVFPGSGGTSGITMANYTQFVPAVVNGATYMEYYASGSGQILANVTTAQVPSAGTILMVGQAIYEAA